MQKKSKKQKKVISADELAEQALGGKNITSYFTKGSMKGADKDIQRVNVDFALPMLRELDSMAAQLNISRQAVIKFLIRQGLDSHYTAKNGRAG